MLNAELFACESFDHLLQLIWRTASHAGDGHVWMERPAFSREAKSLAEIFDRIRKLHELAVVVGSSPNHTRSRDRREGSRSANRPIERGCATCNLVESSSEFRRYCTIDVAIELERHM